MDFATIIGLALAMVAILGGQYLEGGSVRSILQTTAAIIVMGGTFGACLVQFPLSIFLGSMKAVVRAFVEPKVNNREVISEIIRYANKARRQGIVSLESETESVSDPFLKKALNMAVDGIEPKTLRETMEVEISNLEEEGEHAVKFWEAAGGYSPTVGILGAVLGLIHVMGNLSDSSKLGAGIAVAFVATIYGLLTANIVCLPFGTKIKHAIKEELICKNMIVEGLIAIQNGENPHFIEQKLKAFVQGHGEAKKEK